MTENIQKLMPTQQCYLDHVFSWFLLTQMILYYAICQKIIPNQYVFILAVTVSPYMVANDGLNFRLSLQKLLKIWKF